MPTTKAPLILYDNVFDRINSYPLGALTSSGDAPSRGVRFIADYRRERTQWQAATAAANRYVQADTGAGNLRSPDSCWIDRGHNLWGATIDIKDGDDAAFAVNHTLFNGAVPALDGNGNFVAGGDPEAGWCVTEEGSIYTLFPQHAGAGKRYFRVTVVDAIQPLITGIILGQRLQLEAYSNVLDDDAGARTMKSEESEAGYLSTARTYAHRELHLDLKVISATEYDTKIRVLRRSIFEKNQPLFVVMNYGRWPERGWLYQLDGQKWNAPTNGAVRSSTIPLRECGAAIR